MVIWIHTEESDYLDIPVPEYDWAKSVCGEVAEILPMDAPETLGNFVTLTHYVDANLMHDLIMGRSVTGILHLANKMPFNWPTKKQSTVEMATYGSEFVAARTCTEPAIEHCTTLQYLGIPVCNRSYMFGDNVSVANSSTQIHAKLHK